MLDILIALGAGLGGAVCGWFMRSSVASPKDVAARVPAGQPTAEDPARDATPQKSVYEVAEKLRALSLRIAANVDEHQSRVQQVNLVLTDGEVAADPDAIVDVVADLIESNQTMQGQLQEAQQRIQDQAAQIQTAEERALTDSLTRIRNRRAFDSFLKKCHAERHDSPSTLMLLDVDHFKKFNDNFGHLAGDEVLRNVASMLESHLGEMGLVARYGGEEFAVIFKDRDLHSCRGVVERMRRMIGERDVMFEEQRLRVTASVGLAELSPEEALEEWVERVDQGLYKAKASGRDRGYCMDALEPSPLIEAEPGLDRSARGNAGTRNEAMRRQLSDGFGQLHDEESLGLLFAEMSDRLKVIDVGLYVVVVRSDRTDQGPAQRRAVLEAIWAATRSVGQIGLLDNGDFVICMSSVHEQAALQRAHAIRSVLEPAANLSDTESATVSIGLSLVRQEDSFASMVAAARCAVEQAAAGGGNAVATAQAVAAS